MNEENMNVKSNMNSASSMKYECPVCGKQFATIHEYAAHLKQHSEQQKKAEEEEKKQRLADQKKYDKAKLEKLYKVYENAAEEYSKAKEEYIKKYNEYEVTDWHNLFSDFCDLIYRNQW